MSNPAYSRKAMSRMRRAVLDAEGNIVGTLPTAAQLARQAGWLCPGCGRQMMFNDNRRDHPTLDHILPKCRGGQMTIAGNVRNVRLLCGGCNSMLALCGHCPGALAAVVVVARGKLMEPQTIARKWRMQQIAAEAEAEFRRLRAAQEADDA